MKEDEGQLPLRRRYLDKVPRHKGQIELVQQFLDDQRRTKEESVCASQQTDRAPTQPASRPRAEAKRSGKRMEKGSDSDVLAGDQARKERLEGRNKRKRDRAAVCNDDRLREKRGKDKDDDDDHPDGTKKRRCEIENKKGKQKECVVQDRSRSKAAQLKEESRKKEQSHRQQAAALTPQGPTQRPDPGRGFVELLTRFNSMLPEERRITLPQPKHGIFAMGTMPSMQKGIAKPESPKRRLSPSISKLTSASSMSSISSLSSDSDLMDPSSPSSISSSEGQSMMIPVLLELNKRSQEAQRSTAKRLTRLEDSIRELTKLLKNRHADVAKAGPSRRSRCISTCAIVANTNDRRTSRIDVRPSTTMQQAQGSSRITEEVPSLEVDVQHMPWAARTVEAVSSREKPQSTEEIRRRADSQHNESLPSTAPVLAFHGDKPDQHPNGWRAQHKLEEIGMHELHQRFVDAGGPGFRVSTPSKSDTDRIAAKADESCEECEKKHFEYPGAYFAEVSGRNARRSTHDSDLALEHSEQKLADSDPSGCHYHVPEDADHQGLQQHHVDKHPPPEDRLATECDQGDENNPNLAICSTTDQFPSITVASDQLSADEVHISGLPSFCTLSKEELQGHWQPVRLA